MPMLNLLRPHRRTASAQSVHAESGNSGQHTPATTTGTGGGIVVGGGHGRPPPQQQQHHFFHHHSQSASAAIHYTQPPSGKQSPQPPTTADSNASATLPPLNFGSPGLLGSSSPSAFLSGGNGFGGSTTSLVSPTQNGTTMQNMGLGIPSITTMGSSPRIGAGVVGAGGSGIGGGGGGTGGLTLNTNKALPAPPPPTPPLPTDLASPRRKSTSSPNASRPGTGSGGGIGQPQLTPILTPFTGGHRNKEKERDMGANASHPVTPVSLKKHNAKLNLLNPMSLLMRRKASQANNPPVEVVNSRKAGARELPEDFDPGIIYGTRHPDWSSPGPKRNVTPGEGQTRSGSPAVNARVLSPALAGLEKKADGEDHVEKQRTPLFKEHFDEQEMMIKGGQQGKLSPKGAIGSPDKSPMIQKAMPMAPSAAASPAIMATPEMKSPPLGMMASPAVSMGTTLVERSPVDPPPLQSSHQQEPQLTDSVQRAATQASVLMPSASSASTASSSSSDTGPHNRRKKGVTLYDHPLSLPRHLMNNSSRFSFEASSVAGSSPGFDDGEEISVQTPVDPNTIGLAMTNDGTSSPTKNGAIGLGLGLGDVRGSDNNNIPAGGNGIMLNPNRRIYPKRPPPRWNNDLEDDDEDVVDMGAYEAEDDDLYYDDGVILGDYDGEEQGFDNSINQTNLTTLGVQTTPPQELNQAVPALGGDGVPSSPGGLAPTIGGMADKNGPTAYPPFMNPSGAGLGYQQQLSAFYATQGLSHHAGLPLALQLQTLNHSLCKFQQEQLSQQQSSNTDELDSPAPGFGNEIDPAYNPYPEENVTSFDDEDDLNLDMDDPMVAAANAEALAYDTDGFYGQEFGFYSAAAAAGLEQENFVAGGYFGEPGMPGNGAGGPLGSGRPFLVRRPSLTPISERSECSYRNSMVFGFDGVGPPGSRAGSASGVSGLSGGHPLSLAGLTLDDQGDKGEEMSLSQLLRLRRSWGGSHQGSIVNSAPSSPGGANSNNNTTNSAGRQSPIVGPLNTQAGLMGALNLSNPNGYPVYAGYDLGGMMGGNMSMLFGGATMTPGVIQRHIDGMNAAPTASSPAQFQPQGQYLPVLTNPPILQQPQLPLQQLHLTQKLQQSFPPAPSPPSSQPTSNPQLSPSPLLTPEEPIEGVRGEIGYVRGDNGGDNVLEEKGLAREPSAGKQSSAGDSSYASALGSPTTEAVKAEVDVGVGEGRVSLDETFAGGNNTAATGGMLKGRQAVRVGE